MYRFMEATLTVFTLVYEDEKQLCLKYTVYLKGPSQPHLCFVYMLEFGYYILFGTWRNEEK